MIGSNRIEKDQACVAPRPEERGEKRQCDLMCVERLWMIGLMLLMLMSYSRVVSVLLVLLRVDLHILNFLHSFLLVIQQEIF